jgi:hypothetical protein
LCFAEVRAEEDRMLAFVSVLEGSDVGGGGGAGVVISIAPLEGDMFAVCELSDGEGSSSVAGVVFLW